MRSCRSVSCSFNGSQYTMNFQMTLLECTYLVAQCPHCDPFVVKPDRAEDFVAECHCQVKGVFLQPAVDQELAGTIVM